MLLEFIIFGIVANCSAAHVDLLHVEQEVKTVDFGSVAKLHCNSNDEQHNFLFWEIDAGNKVIGPGNQYDDMKYDYEVLSGTLVIKIVKLEDEGIYNCASRGVRNDNINVRTVRMVVKNNSGDIEKDNVGTIVVIISGLIIVFGGGYLNYIYWGDRLAGPSNSVSSDDEEAEAEDFINNFVPSSSGSNNIICNKVATGYDNIGLSNDFKDDSSDDNN